MDKEEPCPQEEVTLDPMEGSPKSVMSNGVNVTRNEEVSVDQESTKQPDENEKQQLPNATSKKDVDDSETDNKLQKRARKIAIVAKEVKHPTTMDSSSDLDAKPKK